MARGAPGRARDRHGRGLRGPLAPPDLPLSRSRAQRFDEIVLDAVEHLEDRWSEQLTNVVFAVEDVPPVAASGQDSGARGRPHPEALDTPAGSPVPLGRLIAADGAQPARIVIYRRPIEARAGEPGALADLVHDVVVDQVAALLGLDPDVVDPKEEDD